MSIIIRVFTDTYDIVSLMINSVRVIFFSICVNILLHTESL